MPIYLDPTQFVGLFRCTVPLQYLFKRQFTQAMADIVTKDKEIDCPITVIINTFAGGKKKPFAMFRREKNLCIKLGRTILPGIWINPSFFPSHIHYLFISITLIQIANDVGENVEYTTQL